MVETVIGILKSAKTYNYAIDAIDEYMPIMIQAYQDIDEQLMNDFPEDVDIPELPAHVFIKLPVFDLTFDLLTLADDFVDFYDLSSKKINTALANASWIKTLNDRLDGFLVKLPIPFTNQLTYQKLIEVATDGEPDFEGIIDSWFEYTKNETTDVWAVVALGEAFPEEVFISLLVVWKAIVYWKVFRMLYKIAKKLGLIDLARKFAAKIMSIPSAIYTRYSLKRKMAKQSLQITESVEEMFETMIPDIDTVVDNLVISVAALGIELDNISTYKPYG